MALRGSRGGNDRHFYKTPIGNGQLPSYGNGRAILLLLNILAITCSIISLIFVFFFFDESIVGALKIWAATAVIHFIYRVFYPLL